MLLLLALRTGAGAGIAWAEPAEWTLGVESGGEYDSNIHRLEVVSGSTQEPIGAPLLRSGVTYQLRLRPSLQQRVELDLRGAAKIFAGEEGQEEDVGVVWARGRYERAIGTRGAGVFVQVGRYDAIGLADLLGTGRSAGRNFATSDGEVTLLVPGEGAHRFGLLVGGRDFEYKPDPDFDWAGEHYGATYSTSFWRGDPDVDLDPVSVDLRASYRVGRRRYEGAAFRNACFVQEMAAPECFVPTPERRFDLTHALAAEAVYTGERIYSLLYGVAITDSNSFGQSTVRQRLELAITAEVLGKIYLTAKGAVLLNTFLDPLLLASDVQSQSFVTIEDENRNSLSLLLSRELFDGWSAEGRYALYSNEFATSAVRFRRQTAYLGLLYRYDRGKRK